MKTNNESATAVTSLQAARNRAGDLPIDRGWRTLVFIAAAIAIILAIACAIIKRDNRMDGDGFEYLMMSKSLLGGGDFRLTDEEVGAIALQAERAGAHVPGRLARAQKGVANTATTLGYFQADNGEFYSFHFVLYPIVNAPALALTTALGLSPYRSVFITNVAIFSLTVVFIAFTRHFSDIGRLMLLSAYVLGGTSYYLRWAGPEVLVGSLSLVGLAWLLAGHYFGAGLALALAAQHDPPVGLLALVPLGGLCLKALRELRARSLSIGDIAAPLVVAAVLVASPAYYYLRFGFPNPHAAFGAAVPTMVSADRVLDLLFGPDLGIVRAMPWLIPALAAAAIALAARGFRREALAVATLPLAAAAVLATAASSTSNWNSGMVVFSRYGVFTAVPLVVGLAYSVDLLSTRAAARRIAASILAVFTLGQLVTVTTYGGFGSGVSYVRYSLASEWLLENFPRFYNPIPETFVERGARTEGLDKGKVFTFARNGQITKILFNEPRADMSISLCGQPLHALAGKSGFPSVRKEDGWIYVNPEAPCPTDMNDGFSIVGPPRVLAVYKGGRLPFAAGGAGPQYLLEGWSQPEPWGVWSDGNRARLQVPFAGLTSDRLRASLHMAAFDRGDGRGQRVVIKVGEASHELQLAGAPGQYHFEFLNPGGPAGTGTVSITFDLPDATSPKSISRSNDPRQLGVALRDISIVESK